jgi:uncharacterized Tic20 family protein
MTQDNDQEARNWAMLCHLSSIVWIPLALLLALIGIPLPIPFLNIVGPLVVCLSKKNQHPLIDAHGKESLNFQISLTIYSVIAGIVFLFLITVTCGIGFSSSSSTTQSPLVQIGLVLGIAAIVLSLIVGIVQLFLVIFAAIKAKKGEFYHYPFTLRFLR